MSEDDSPKEEDFYTEERWNNWMNRISEEDFDPEGDDGALLFFNLQDDITIACANAVERFDDGTLDAEECLEEINKIREIVMEETTFSDDDKSMMLEGVQTSLIGVFASCEAYLANGGGPDADAPIDEYVAEAADAEMEDDMDRALGLVSEAGAMIIDGEDFDADELDVDVEYGFVSEWINGLDSLEDAVSGPEMIEDDD
ncbi:MAG: DUF2150 family protein [Halobacteria archaeon]|nr:DUF2150 family protein [Halobacteria archaeon]